MSRSCIRVVVALRSPLVRTAVARLLDGRDGLQVIDEVGTGPDALDRAIQGRPDVLLADMDLAELDGCGLARALQQRVSPTESVLVGERDDDVTVRQAFRAGARGFVWRGGSVEDLLEALQAAVRGDYYVSRLDLRERVTDFVSPNGGSPAPGGRITPRERELACLLADGYSSKEAAGVLGISVKTVETHRASLMRKLGARNVADVVKYCIRNRLIQV